MKLRSSTSQSSASATRGDVAQKGMVKYRFTSGEEKAIQLGYAMIVFSFGLFAFLANTMLLPALRNQSLYSTECYVVRSEVTRVPMKTGPRTSRCTQEIHLCLKVYVLYNSNAGDVNIKQYAEQFGPSQNDMNIHRVGEEQQSNSSRKLGRNQPKPMHVMQAVLRYDKLQLNWGPQAACTVRPACPDSADNNYQQMASLQHSLGRPGLHVPCFYDPRNLANVILRKKYNTKTITDSIFWPSLIFVMGVLILLFTQCCTVVLKSIMTPTKIGVGREATYI